MSDPKNPFEDLMKITQDWAQKMGAGADAFSAENIEKLWPTMSKDMMEGFMGKGANPEGLDAKSRLLMTLLGLTIQGAVAEAQIRLTLRHLTEAGTTKQEINETIAMAGLFGGAPAMSKAMNLAASVADGQET